MSVKIVTATAVCPHCGSKTSSKREAYWGCGTCDLWFQSPLPPKKFEAPQEKGPDGRSNGHNQSEADLNGAARLARAWAHNWISKIPAMELEEGTSRPFKKALDIGCKYPYFAHVLRREFHIDAYGIDGMDFDENNQEPILSEYSQELGVPMLMVDFEKVTPKQILSHTWDSLAFDAISMIHVFEHMYDADAALKNIHQLLRPEGYFLVRVPSHEVQGMELHMSPRHYGIHPYFYSEKSMRHLIDKNGLFEICETYPVGGGTRDYILKPKS